MLRVISLIICVLGMSGCVGACEGLAEKRVHLHHDYYVHNHVVEQIHGASGNYVLECKLAYPGDPLIAPNVVMVEWDSKAIIAKRRATVGDEYYIIVASGQTLQCGNNDVLHGPYTLDQFEEKRKELGLTDILDKKAYFELPE